MATAQDPKVKGESNVAELIDLIDDWERVREEIEKVKREIADLKEMAAPSNMMETAEGELRRLQRARRESRVTIAGFVSDHPKLRDVAVSEGFPSRLLKGGSKEGDADVGPDEGDRFEGGGKGGGDAGAGGAEDGAGAGGGGGGGKGGGKKPDLRGQARDNRLLDGGILERGPQGMFVNTYVYRIDGEVIRVSIKLGRDPDRLQRYGLKASDAKVLTKAQMKRRKSIGWADELAPNIRKGDKHVFKSLTRYLRNQYGGQAMLEDDEVMAKVIANSMFGWSAGEFENQLRNTKWYKNTNPYQRDWATVTSAKEKRERINSTFQEVVNTLEDHWGLDWVKNVDGGMQKAREWAEMIASGKWGTPDQGLQFWADKQFDRAKLVEGTPAWITEQQEQEAIRSYLNRPEDMFETIRSQAMDYLGQVRGKPLVDRDTLKSWATDLVTEKRSDGDWQQYLRDQMKTLHPYFDHNRSFTEQASPFKSIAESIVGTTVAWDDDLMLQIAGRDKDGNLLGTPRSLHDFAQYVRDNDPRFWSNPQTEEKSRAFGQELLSIMGGV